MTQPTSQKLLVRPAAPWGCDTSAQGPTPPNKREGREVRPPADCVYIQTLCKEWASAMAFPNPEERNRWLTRYLSIYKRLRKHSALGWPSPQQRLAELFR